MENKLNHFEIDFFLRKSKKKNIFRTYIILLTN